MDGRPEHASLTVVAHAAAATRVVGAALGALVPPGMLVTLSGPLGAGKTTLAQGIAAGLGIREPIVSPTFTLVREYAGVGTRPGLWHADLYRVVGAVEAVELALDDGLAEGAVVAVEWPEHGASALGADDRLAVVIGAHGAQDARRIEVRAHGEAARCVLAALAERLRDRAGIDAIDAPA